VAQAVGDDPEAASHLRQCEAKVLASEYLAGRLPESAQLAIAGFLARYGMRGVGEIDLGAPRWREDPTPIKRSLQSYLQIEEPAQAPDAVFARGEAAAQTAIEELARQAQATRGGKRKARRVRWAVRRVRALGGLRESPKFWVIRVMGLVREALLDSGGELVDTGVLDRADDLFFLRLEELRSLGAGETRDWKGLVAERRNLFTQEQRRRQVPRLLLSDGQAFYEGVSAEESLGEGVLAGSPVSPGVVEGQVRVVLDPHQDQLLPGEILVCPGTDPAWTPLFLVAGGLVMETGGLMTHGAVVAREYGLPAVVGVSRATERLATGQQVRVDATVGRVVPLEHHDRFDTA
jgi:pyruvate,water dikinase